MKGSSIQSVERAFAVLDLLSEGPGSLSDVREALGISAPGATKILRTLEALGLTRSTGKRTHVLASGCCRYAHAYCAQESLVDVSWREMSRISLETDNHSILAVLEGIEKVNLLRLDVDAGWQSLHSQIPQRIGPALTQATGRVLLASASPEIVAGHIQQYPLSTFGGAIKTAKALHMCLDEVREQGHAVLEASGSELHYVAAPVLGPAGKAVAALGAHVSPAHNLDNAIVLVRDAASRVSAAFGNDS